MMRPIEFSPRLQRALVAMLAALLFTVIVGMGYLIAANIRANNARAREAAVQLLAIKRQNDVQICAVHYLGVGQDRLRDGINHELGLHIQETPILPVGDLPCDDLLNPDGTGLQGPLLLSPWLQSWVCTPCLAVPYRAALSQAHRAPTTSTAPIDRT